MARLSTAIPKDVAFWGAVMLAGAVGVSLIKVMAARLPLPDGVNEWAASL